MKRRLFTILFAVSLLLCVAVVVLWVRSYWVVDQAEGGYWRFQPVTNQPATSNTPLERGKAFEITHFRGSWLIHKLDRRVHYKWREDRHWQRRSYDIEKVEEFMQHAMGAKYGWHGNPGTWVWFGVDDVKPLYERYKANGATILMPPTNFPWALEFRVQDPDGHVLRFGSDPLEDK